MCLKGLHFSEVEISSKKYIKEMENFGEEKEIIISCKWALKHCHFSCHVMTGFAYCRLLHIQFYFFFVSKALPKYRYCHHHLRHADSCRSLFPRMQLTTIKRLHCLTDRLLWWCLHCQLSFGVVLGMV